MACYSCIEFLPSMIAARISPGAGEPVSLKIIFPCGETTMTVLTIIAPSNLSVANCLHTLLSVSLNKVKGSSSLSAKRWCDSKSSELIPAIVTFSAWKSA